MENQLAIFETQDGKISLLVQLENETVWLTQEQMTRLFERDQSVISRHLRNVFAEGELDEKSNMQKMHITGNDKPTSLYSLDVVISVGYRVKSKRGTQFRIWATQVLRQHLVEGYTINRKRLDELHRTVQLIAGSLSTDDLNLTEARSSVTINRSN